MSMEETLKLKLVTAIAKVSDEDFEKAAIRWLDGFNAKSMIGNFISIMEEYEN